MIERQRCSQRSFHTNDTIWCVVEIAFFFWCVRSVVGDNTINCPIQNTFQNGFPVFFRPQRRTHPVIGIFRQHLFFGQQEIMWASFAGDRNAFPLCQPDNFHAALCADVCDVNRTVHRASQNDFSGSNIVLRSSVHALYLQLFGNSTLVDDTAVNNGEVFTVGNHWQVQIPCLFQSQPHLFGILYRSAIVRNRTDTSLHESRIITERFAFHAVGNAADGVYLDACRSSFV